MADPLTGTQQTTSGQPDIPGIPADGYAVIELLFFAYRDFTGDPDTVLAKAGFGRAHHRVLHFVARNPGIRVTGLLDILRITKQSLARVLKQLVSEGLVLQQPGPEDRRERLLFLTDEGAELVGALAKSQYDRIERAFSELPEEAQASVRAFLYLMIDEDQRSRAAALCGLDPATLLSLAGKSRGRDSG